jgi:hypothetical protein
VLILIYEGEGIVFQNTINTAAVIDHIELAVAIFAEGRNIQLGVQ